jgi:MPBQ/MSBQ methyltransferase
MRTKTNILAASVPVEIKSNFVSNIVSRIRDFTSGILITNKIAAIGAVIISAVFLILREVLWKPSRTYDRDANSVGREYDAWTTEGILEEYWGEHIHLGYYSPEELAAGYKKKNFIQAKYDFVDQMMDFGKARSLAQPMTVLDVGCGIGGKIKMPSS